MGLVCSYLDFARYERGGVYPPLSRRARYQRCGGVSQHPFVSSEVETRAAMDFEHDGTSCGRQIPAQKYVETRDQFPASQGGGYAQ